MRTQLVFAVLGLLLRCSAEDPAAPQSSTGPRTFRATPKETPGAAAVPAVPSSAPAASHTTSSAPPRSSVLQPTAAGAASVPQTSVTASPTVAAARDQKSPSTVSTVKATSVAPGSTSTTPKVMATAATSTPKQELGTASSEKTTAAVTTASARNAVTTASARTTASDAVNSQVSGSSTQPGSATSAKTGSTGGQGSGQGTDKPGGAGTQSATTASVTSQQASQVTTPTPSQADTSRSASPVPTLVVTASSPHSPGGSVTSLTSVTPVSSSSPMVSPTVTNQMTPTTPTSTATTGGIKPAVGGGESTVGSKSTIGQSGPPVGSTPAIGRSTLALSEKPALTVTSASMKPQPAGPTLTPTLPSQKHPGVPSHTPLGSNITVFTLPTGNYKVLCETAQKPREEEMLVLNLTKSNPCVDVSQNENLVIFLCEKAAKTSFNATRDQCHIELMSFPGSQAVAIKEISIQTRVFPSGIHKLLGDKRNDLQRLGVSNMTFGDKGFLEETEDRFSMPLIITIVSMASFLLLVAALYGCCHQRLSHRKDQQRLTEELQTVENGYHDNPTLEVMETSSEMQEKKGVSLNGELGDSWIVPLDNLTKEDLEEEEDTHL